MQIKRYLGSFVLAACALPVFAQSPTSSVIRNYMPDGANLEAQADGDLNGDGQTDTAFLWRREGEDEERGLMAILAYRGGAELDWQPVGEAKLDPFPQGAGTLAIRKGVLIFEDLTGGTTATASTRRYRYDAKQDRMRLIGIDAERYSRTNRHGTVKISWNLLNGRQVIERGEPNTSGRGDEALIYAKPEHGVHTASAVWMERSLDPDELIDAEIAAEGEDRD